MLPALIAAGASLAGGLIANRRNRSAAEDSYKHQKEFAQQGIQWKVADAKKAGIHPLYAMGSPGASFTPMALGDSLGPALSNAGQDLSRAMYQNADAETRANARGEALRLENMGLQNDLLRAQIANLTNQVGPATPGVQSFPVDSGNVLTRDLVSLKPAEITSARSNDPSITAGPAGPGFTEFDLGDVLGKWNLPSGGVAESTDDLELLKYMMLIGKNHEKLGYLKNVVPNLVYQYATRPDWVKRVEKDTNQRLLPFYRADGKLYWRGTHGR